MLGYFAIVCSNTSGISLGWEVAKRSRNKGLINAIFSNKSEKEKSLSEKEKFLSEKEKSLSEEEKSL